MKIVFTPDWFLNNDILIEIISFMVLFLFFLFSVKCYKLNRKKSIIYLGIGFLLIAIGELSTIFTKLILYYDIGITQEIGRAVINSQIVKTVDIFYYTGFFFNKFLSLLGLYVIYKIPFKKLSGESLLAIYLILLAALLSNSLNYVYHLTALILLGLIINNYYQIYKKDKLTNTRMLIAAFVLLAISQAMFLLSKLDYLYVTAQGIQLVSYITLFILIIKILKNGKKEKQDGHHARHTKNYPK